MANTIITSGKIKGDYCHYSFEEKTENGAQIVNVCPEIIIHDDLRKSFRQLVPHLMYICDYYTTPSQDLQVAIDDIENVDDSNSLCELLTQFKVSAIKVSGIGDAQSVVISGEKRLNNGKKLSLSTPAIKWEDDYEFIQELKAAVITVQNEILQYSEGKKAPDDPTLFDDFEENDGFEEEL